MAVVAGELRKRCWLVGERFVRFGDSPEARALVIDVYGRSVDDEQFIADVVALAERAVAAGTRSEGEQVLAYLEGGMIPLGDALDDGELDPLFAESVGLLTAGWPLAEVLTFHQHVSKLRLAQLQRYLDLEAHALQLLAGAATPRAIEKLLSATLRLGAKLVP